MFDTKPALRLLLVALAAFALPSLASDTEPRTIGAGVTLEEATPIATILAGPMAWKGREVRVEGEVTGVCTKKGCWMDLSDAEGNTLKVRVEDGVLVFPEDAEGLRASAEGTVSVQEMDRERYLGWQQHLASDRGETFDESTLGEGPYLLVEIAGTGARVEGP